MKKNRILALSMAALMTMSCLAACSSSSSSTASTSDSSAEASTEAAAEGTSYYIGKVPITLSHSVHGNDAKWAAVYAAEEYGATYEVIDPESDLAKENQAIEDFIAKGVDGLIVHPVVESGVNESIQAALDAGIAVITYYMDATEVEVPFVAVDEAGVAKEMGTDMAKQWKELYPDEPIAVGFVDFLSVAITKDSRSGPFLEGVKTVEPNLTGTAMELNSAGEELTGATFWLAGEGDLTTSQAIGQDVLTKYPEVNLIYGTNTANALGCLSAYEAVGRGQAEDGVPLTEIFAGTDGDASELLKLADPNSSLKYTLGMQPQTFAYAQIDTIISVLNGDIARDDGTQIDVSDVYLNYYKDSVQDMEDWFNVQYLPETPLDIAAELAK
ncbi:sugar ABC transporter substrate-binding protein [Chakrabartyella piscis]|uniref:sugar ABC transporter substrate-binding protein n=1 Tax=Chakrabartyella piscis TaxID=2918914 RepID=UPI002958A282|nr:substrate-binding domain-containing protein [Chakrabartyella piscis]